MMDIRGWDKLKLYEGSSGAAFYLERMVRKLINAQIRRYCRNFPNTQLASIGKERAENVVVSLTSFPARIHQVDLAVKSLLHQTVIPGKVVLWLAQEQFEGVKIPKKLTDLCNYGLEIRFCKEDILAHKKYYYSMLEYPDKLIVTYDDDLIYPEDSLERLLDVHKRNPNVIVCNRGREIAMTAEGEIAPYKYWKVNGDDTYHIPSYRYMASTGAGTLYPPGCMPEETFNLEKIKTLALTADDLWMKAMSIVAGIPVVKTSRRNKGLCLSCSKRGIALADRNVEENLNDTVMENLVREFPIIKTRLLEEDSVNGK